MDVAKHILSLARAALDRWITTDPDGYLSLHARDATYFAPFREKRVDGLDDLSARGDSSDFGAADGARAMLEGRLLPMLYVRNVPRSA